MRVAAIVTACLIGVTAAYGADRQPTPAAQMSQADEHSQGVGVGQALDRRPEAAASLMLDRIGQLQLTPEQREQLRTLQARAERDVAPLQEQVREKEQQLYDLLVEGEVDDAEVQSQVNEIAELRKQVAMRYVNCYRNMNGQLSSDQRMRLRNKSRQQDDAERGSMQGAGGRQGERPGQAGGAGASAAGRGSGAGAAQSGAQAAPQTTDDSVEAAEEATEAVGEPTNGAGSGQSGTRGRGRR